MSRSGCIREHESCNFSDTACIFQEKPNYPEKIVIEILKLRKSERKGEKNCISSRKTELSRKNSYRDIKI